MALSSNDADALASWGGGQDLSAWEALMWRTGGDYRTRSTGVMVELLDTEPDWDRLVAAHDRFTQLVPRLRERVVEPVLSLVTPAWSPDPHFDLEGWIALLADRASNIFDLEPVDIPYRLARLGDRIAHGLVEAVVGYSNHLDYLERLVWHGILLCGHHPH